MMFGFKLFSAMGCLVTGVLLSSAVHARILFVETFSTGTTPLATGQWDVSETGTDFVLEEDSAGQGPGDGLLALLGTQDSGGSPAWGDHIYSKQSFPRGNNLRVSFRMWNKFGTNALSAFHGPFHNSNTGHIYANIEAGFDYTYSTYRWGEATNLNPIQQGATLTGVNSNYNGNTKNGSMLVKMRLGNDRGARLDWYRTDVNNPSSNPKAEPEIDTIGQTLQPTGQNGITTLTTGNAATVWLGFGNFDGNAGTVYIDDILVENDEVANPGGKTILYVWASRDWRATSNTGGGFIPGGDLRIMHLLEQIGYNVVPVDDHDSTSADANNVDAVVISSTVSGGAVAAKFLNTTKGVMTWESGIMDDMNFVTSIADAANAPGQTQLLVDGTNTTLTTGLNGTVTTSVNSDNYRYITIPAGSGAQKVASIAGQPNQAAIVAYEKDAAMANSFSAPGRRLAFFLGDFRASETLTPQGRALFKAAVDWIAAGGTPVVTPNAARNWNLFD